MNTHINKNRKPGWDRKFLGKLTGFVDKEEQRFEQKHLDAYIKGQEEFQWGFTNMQNPRTGLMDKKPNFVTVKQEVIKL